MLEVLVLVGVDIVDELLLWLFGMLDWVWSMVSSPRCLER